MNRKREPPASCIGGLPFSEFPRHLGIKGIGWTLAVLLLGLFVTGIATLAQRSEADQRSYETFLALCSDLQSRIETRIKSHDQLLHAGAAFFSDSDGITQDEWRDFVTLQKFDDKSPGIQGLGFALWVPAPQLEQHIREIRHQGLPDYQVWPEGEREHYSPVILLQPINSRNRRAFGYDMYAEPVRREAMERARDRNETALSGRVTLIQETSKTPQPGALMFAPVYRTGMATGTVDERRKALAGWVYCPYRMNNLMESILGGWNPVDSSRIHVRIFDGAPGESTALLYDNQTGETADPKLGMHESRQEINVSGRPWLLLFSQPKSHANAAYSKVWLVFGSGTLISLLLAGLALSLSNTRINAAAIAGKLTRDLQESESRWKFAIDGAGDGLWDWNIPEGTVFFARRWKEMLGFREDEIGTSVEEWSKRVHPDDLEHTLADAQAHLDGKTASYASEHRILCKDGEWKWILDRGLVVARDDQGKPLRMIGTHSDITDRKNAELDRKSNEARFRAILECSPVPMAGNDALLNVTFVNPAFEQLFGYSHADIPTVSAWWPKAYPDPEYRQWVIDNWLAELNRVKQTGEPFSPMKIVIRCKDGSEKIVQVSAAPLSESFKDDHIVVFIDVTETESLQKNLREARDKAEDASRVKSDFLAVMSHELRTPLNGVLGFAELLSTTVLDPMQSEYIRTIHESGEHLLSIVNDILDFSSIEKGRLPLESAGLPITELVDSCGQFISTIAKKKGLLFSTRIASDVPPWIMGDARRIRQILLNLLGNAVKFTSQGSVSLAVSCEIAGDKTVLIFSVQDAGPGIAAPQLDRLFEPFTQVESTLHRSFEGTGLGLAISRRLAEAMEGSITVSSRIGEGSTFTFLLPVVIAPAGPAAEKLPAATGDPKSPHPDRKPVLIVEDDQTSSLLAKKILTSLGYEMVSVPDGQGAIEVFEPGKFSAIMMDMQMPVIDGLQATLKIREIEGADTGRIPIIAVTANVMSGDRERCLEAGMDDFLTKPYKRIELAEKLARHVRC